MACSQCKQIASVPFSTLSPLSTTIPQTLLVILCRFNHYFYVPILLQSSIPIYILSFSYFYFRLLFLSVLFPSPTLTSVFYFHLCSFLLLLLPIFCSNLYSVPSSTPLPLPSVKVNKQPPPPPPPI